MSLFRRDDTFVHREQGKKWTLPLAVNFNSNSVFYQEICFYKVVGFRCPKANEYFLSGSIPEAYFTEYDLTTKYLVVIPTSYAKQVNALEVGDEIKLHHGKIRRFV